MAFLVQHVDQGFDRLQALLLALRAGDVLYVGDAVRVSGLSEGTCRTALEALANEGIPFSVQGKATYEQQVAAIRGSASSTVQ